MKKILFDVFIILVAVTTIVFVYLAYGEQISLYIKGNTNETMLIKGLPISVSVADSLSEQKQGLSGLKNLGDFEGKLFIFSKEDYQKIWMKDMFIPLDVYWINDNLEIIHIKENLTPETYPDVFTSPTPARYVLEVNAFFSIDNNVVVGDKIILPASLVP